MTRTQQIDQLEQLWQTARWQGITRPYSAAEVVNLRGSVLPPVRWQSAVRKNYGRC